MEMVEPWSFEKEDDDLRLIVGDDRLGRVTNLTMSKSLGYIRVSTDKEKKKLCLEKFQSNDKNGPPTSRTKFLKTWSEHVNPADTDSSEDASPSQSFSQDDERMSPVSQDDERMSPIQKTTVTAVQDRIKKDYCLGTYDVHIENLVAPDQSRATRLIDHSHVGTLTDSYSENNCGQLVILVGMLTDLDKLESVEKPGKCQIEVLGGNHSRVAMQTLYSRGALDTVLVKVTLYKPLDRVTALAIGYEHNIVLHEKKKPMTYVDKLRMMRTTRDGQTPLEWKALLTIVFRAKDKRQFQQMYSYHLLVAQLKDIQWVKVIKAIDKYSLNEKFLRKLMRLDDECLIDSCLDVLLEEGQAAFKKKVNDMVEQGRVKSAKKRTVSLTDTDEAESSITEDVEDRTENNCNNENETLKERLEEAEAKYRKLQDDYRALLRENEKLKEKINKEPTTNNIVQGPKRKSSDDSGQGAYKTRKDDIHEHMKGDLVLACYVDENGEQWLEAKVLNVQKNGLFKVQYQIDGFKENLHSSMIKRL